MKNDVGCLRLTEAVELNEYVQLVALNFDFVDREEPSFVVGWGLIAVSFRCFFFLMIGHSGPRLYCLLI